MIKLVKMHTVLAALCSLLIVAVFSGLARAQEPPAYRLVYGQYSEGQNQIWSMHPDGSNAQLLFSGGLESQWLAPDGGSIAYIANKTGSDYTSERWDLYAAEIASGAVSALVTQQHASRVAWSPDGAKLAYVTTTYFNRGIEFRNALFVARSDGTETIQLFGDQRILTGPSWSPDGQTILFSAQREFGGVETLYAVQADGGRLRAWFETDAPCFICDAPRWSPDGASIVIMQYPDLHRMDAGCIDLPTGCAAVMQKLTSFDGVYNATDVSHSRYGKPIYSLASDGRFLIYTFGYRRQGGGIDIALVAAEPGGWQQRRILHHSDDFGLGGNLLSPDDRFVFFNEAVEDNTFVFRTSVEGNDPPLALAEGWALGIIEA